MKDFEGYSPSIMLGASIRSIYGYLFFFLLLCLADTLPAEASSAAVRLAKKGCKEKCGDISIHYPFGINKGCYLAEDFEVHCEVDVVHKRNHYRPILRKAIPRGDGKIREDLSEIRLVDGEVIFLVTPIYHCQNNTMVESEFPLPKHPYLFSSRNKFVSIGCNTMASVSAVVNSKNNHTVPFQTGCDSFCMGINYVKNGSCSGIGCCKIPHPNYNGIDSLNLSLNRFRGDENLDFSPCGFIIPVDQTAFKFNISLFESMMGIGRKIISDAPGDHRKILPKFPVAVEWWIGNRSCAEARNAMDFACVAKNSHCTSSPHNSSGYRCNCSKGFKGNPYLLDGCQDVDECVQANPCKKICVNTHGSYYCTCQKGYHGDGTVNGTGCNPPASNVVQAIMVGLGGEAAFLFLITLVPCFHRKWKKRNIAKLKKQRFLTNRGLLLQQLISSDASTADMSMIFSLQELEKATNNFDSSRIVGGGGHGTVYKGILSDQRVVAIKKAKVSNPGELDQFINEVAILSETNHRNVVRLYGCCLEAEVPLLVYEFISNGTLYDRLHAGDRKSSLSWDIRLKIAAEAAGALAYLHSAASKSIYHRDVKSANILLDDTYTAKVSDFGASRYIPVDRSHVTTVVQGTVGYLDPEYFSTSQLTEKSDVYSFGVILAELLTGEKPVCQAENKNLATRFLWSVVNDEQFEVVEERIKKEATRDEIEQVVTVAARCLRQRGEERPSMKDVEAALVRLSKTAARSSEQQWSVDGDEEGNKDLLHVASSRRFSLEIETHGLSIYCSR